MSYPPDRTDEAVRQLQDNLTPPDSVAGFDRTPTRYSGQERETIDRQRDYSHALATEWLAQYEKDKVALTAEALSDLIFASHCRMNALKYEDREGKKDVPANETAKANWYMTMAQHVDLPDLVSDPRWQRIDGYQPYIRQTFKRWS